MEYSVFLRSMVGFQDFASFASTMFNHEQRAVFKC